MSLQRLLEELTLERYGPVIRGAQRVPHLPLWLYREQWREEDTEGTDDSAAIEAFERRRVRQAEREATARAAQVQRKLRVLTAEEAAGAA